MAAYDIKEQRIYPILNPSAPSDDDTQSYRLKTIKEIQKYLDDEIIERSRLAKKFKQCRVISTCVHHGLTATTVIITASGIASLFSGVGTPITIILGMVGFGTTLTTSVSKRLESIYSAKYKKHDDICIVAQTVLDGISTQLSQSIQDGVISHQEFNVIIQKKKQYLDKKQEIQKINRKKIQSITKAQREEILEVGRKEGRDEIVKKLVQPSDTPHVTAT